MKGFAGTVMAVARELARSGVVPRRDLVLAFLADEEAGGVWGAKWLVENRPELFAGVTEAIGEVGGFSVPLPPRATASAARTCSPPRRRARAGRGCGRGAPRGTPRPREPDTAVLRLARAVAALGEHRFPVERTDATTPFLAAFSELTGQDDVWAGPRVGARRCGAAALRGADRCSRRATSSTSSRARRSPRSTRGWCRAAKRPSGARWSGSWATDVSVEWVLSNAPVWRPSTGPLVQTVRAAVAQDDPDGVVVPYLLPASTDNKNFSQLGIAGYGFTPLRVPAGFDAFGQFHAVDERVPLTALRFGARVMHRILRTA